MDERYGVNESMKVQDVDWIGEASRRGEAILCKDKAVASVPLEAQTIYMNDARVFAMASGRITGQEMIRRLLVHQDGIFRWASMKPGPFVCGVHADRIARLKLAYL
jgi:hypothetical protein